MCWKKDIVIPNESNMEYLIFFYLIEQTKILPNLTLLENNLESPLENQNKIKVDWRKLKTKKYKLGKIKIRQIALFTGFVSGILFEHFMDSAVNDPVLSILDRCCLTRRKDRILETRF